MGAEDCDCKVAMLLTDDTSLFSATGGLAGTEGKKYTQVRITKKVEALQVLQSGLPYIVYT